MMRDRNTCTESTSKSCIKCRNLAFIEQRVVEQANDVEIAQIQPGLMRFLIKMDA